MKEEREPDMGCRQLTTEEMEEMGDGGADHLDMGFRVRGDVVGVYKPDGKLVCVKVGHKRIVRRQKGYESFENFAVRVLEEIVVRCARKKVK